MADPGRRSLDCRFPVPLRPKRVLLLFRRRLEHSEYTRCSGCDLSRTVCGMRRPASMGADTENERASFLTFELDPVNRNVHSRRIRRRCGCVLRIIVQESCGDILLASPTELRLRFLLLQEECMRDKVSVGPLFQPGRVGRRRLTIDHLPGIMWV